MFGKFGFKGQHKKERSVFEIVTEDGTMRTRDILYIVRRLCLADSRLQGDERRGLYGFIHPKNVIAGSDGNVRLDSRALPLPELEAYLPPELDRAHPGEAEAKVFGLGMLMLFMASGQENKTDMDTVIADRTLLSLIERCSAFDPMARFSDTGALLNAIRKTGGFWKRAQLPLCLAVVVCLLAWLLFSFWQSGKTSGGAAGEAEGYGPGYARGYDQGISDAPGIGIGGASVSEGDGNLSGNLSAAVGAFAVSGKNAVYYLLEDGIWRMNPYSGGQKRIAAISGVTGLHFYDGRLYCTTAQSVFRLDSQTGKEDVFCDSHGGRLYIFRDRFYLYDSGRTGYLYRINPESGALTQLNGAMKYRCLNVVSDKLYYIDTENGACIYCSDLDGGNVTLISSHASETFCVHEGRIYSGTRNGLIRMDLNGGSLEKLSALAAYSPNVSDGGIFYVSGSGRTLEWMSPDGRMRYTVVHTRTGSFNVAGRWIFYQNDEDGGRLWRVRVNGSDNARIAP